MYDLEPALAESDYRGAFTATLARFRRRALLVVLTDLVEQAVGESLAPALPLICARHLVVIGAVQDPEVVAWARATPTGTEEAYRKAAAVAALAGAEPHHRPAPGPRRHRGRRRPRPPRPPSWPTPTSR